MYMTLSEPNDFILNVSGLLKENVGATRTFDLAGSTLQLDSEMQAHELSGSVRLLRIRKGVLAEGQVAGDVTLECSRCLEPLHTRIEAPFEGEFRPSVDIQTGLPAEALEEGESEDDFFRITPNHMLDLNEPVRQMLLLGLPIKPVCRSDCAGICPQCGVDLNAGGCGCVRDTGDSRLAALAVLLEEMDDQRRSV